MLNLGRCLVLEAELWAIFHALSIAWHIGLRSLIVESDSMHAVHLIKQDITDSHLAF